MQNGKRSFAEKILRFGVLFYRKLISPCLPKNCCRYTPSCSQYALDALDTHGAVYGSWLVFKRLLRCSPFGGSGYDPVPPALSSEERKKFYKKSLICAGFFVLLSGGFWASDFLFSSSEQTVFVNEKEEKTQNLPQYNPAVRFLRWIILSYQANISPLLKGQCRFTPTCSQYGLQAVEKHGAFKGGWLTLKRIFRCNPWGTGGNDPVPEQ